MCVGISCTKQFSDIGWVSSNLIQFRHCLPEENVRSHRFRVQLSETDTHFRCQPQVVGLHVTYNLCPVWLQLRGSHDFFPLVLCCAVLSHSIISDSFLPCGLQPARLLCSWAFSSQEYWSGLPCPPLGGLPNPGIEPRSPALQVDSLLSEPPWKPGKPPGKPVKSHDFFFLRSD